MRLFCFTIFVYFQIFSQHLNQIGSLGYEYSFSPSNTHFITKKISNSSVYLNSTNHFNIPKLNTYGFDFYFKPYGFGFTMNSFNFEEYSETNFGIRKQFDLENWVLGTKFSSTIKTIKQYYENTEYSLYTELSYFFKEDIINLSIDSKKMKSIDELSLRYLEIISNVRSSYILKMSETETNFVILLEYITSHLNAGIAYDFKYHDFGYLLGIKVDRYVFDFEFMLNKNLGLSKSLSIAFLL